MALWTAGEGIFFGLVPVWFVFLYLSRKRCAGPAFSALLAASFGFLMGAARMECKTAELLAAERTAAEILAESSLASGNKARLRSKNGGVLLEGIIVESEKRADGEKWVLRDCRVSWKQTSGGDQSPYSKTIDFPGKILCYVKSEGFEIGDRVTVSGSVKCLKAPGNPGEYDYRRSCLSKGIICEFYGERARWDGQASQENRTGLDQGRFLGVSRALRRFRQNLGERLDRCGEPEDAGILKAVLLGDRSSLDSEAYSLYQKNGISHLLAISGLHMSIIGMGLWRLLRRVGCTRGSSSVIAGSILILYGTMTGFSPSVFRAAFMLLLSFLADWLGRTYDLISALAAAAFVLLMKEPWLLTQAAFQLSFLAVGGIAFMGQPLINSASFKGTGNLFKAFLMSLSVQLSTIPAILYHSFEIPPYGILLNLLVIPPMTVVLYSGLAALAVSGAWKGAAIFCLGSSHFVLLFYERLCGFVQKLPGAVWCMGRPLGWQIVLYYTLAFAGVRVLCGAKKTGRSGLGAGSGLWLCAVLILLPIPSGGLSVTFLDVGQGDGIYLSSEQGNLLVDCGSSQNKKLGEYSLVPFLKSQGVTRLDTVVITHGDEDHVSGIRYLLENPQEGIRIHHLIMPKAGAGDQVYEKLEAKARSTGASVSYLERGDRIWGPGGSGNDSRAAGQAGILCIYPSNESRCRTRNDQSLVLLLNYGQFRLLLTGDLEAAGERELVDRGDIEPVTILKAGHHGSSTSSGEEFLKALSPSGTILSYGEGNSYGHPDSQVVERLLQAGSAVWETAKSGAVNVWTDGKRLKIRGFKKSS